MSSNIHKRVLPVGTRVKLTHNTSIFFKGETGVIVEDNCFTSTVRIDGMNLWVFRSEIAVTRQPRRGQGAARLPFYTMR